MTDPSPADRGVALRAAREDDLGGLLAIARSLESPLTGLPDDSGNILTRIETSLRSFDPRVRAPGAEYYLFVLEDDKGTMLGTSAIMARMGGFDPSYTFEVRRETSTHPPQGITREHDVLHLRREHKGPSEIGGLALKSDVRARGLGRLLSLGRFLFVNAFPERFADRFVAELRGWLDDDGRSPFWEQVGRPFFGCDLADADLLSALGDKDFIEDLVPTHPIYVELLAPAARDAMGRVNDRTRPARAMLDQEGFASTGEVDIFDAGPSVEAETARIRTVRLTRRAIVREVIDTAPGGPLHVISNAALDFRATLDAVHGLEHGAVGLSSATARLLRVGEGDEVTLAPARGEA